MIRKAANGRWILDWTDPEDEIIKQAIESDQDRTAREIALLVKDSLNPSRGMGKIMERVRIFNNHFKSDGTLKKAYKGKMAYKKVCMESPNTMRDILESPQSHSEGELRANIAPRTKTLLSIIVVHKISTVFTHTILRIT